MPDQPAPDAREYRRTMGLFATGVSVLIAVSASGEPIGMTANAITSVSLDPLLLLVCVGRDAHVAPRLLDESTFTLSFLRASQGDVSDLFAGRLQGDPPPVAFEPFGGGLRLSDCLGAVACEQRNVHDGGDHWIVIARVTDLYRADDASDPLIFFGGQYRRLDSPAE
jgi:flavin reductase (DIM6/NTAB) family NADH-FMN oxidoreductase RutF